MIAAPAWPAAVVWVSAIAAAAFVLSVLIWSIVQTGRTAISHDR